MAEVVHCMQLIWLKGKDKRVECVLKRLEKWIALMIEMYLKFVVELGSSRITVKWSRYPYQNDTINKQFDKELPSLEEGKEHKRTLSIINVNKDGKHAKCYRTLEDGKRFPESLAGKGLEVYFHGTGHAGAQNIIETGIRLRAGEAKQDFSCGDGFYVFQNFDEALDWAGKRHRNPAVLCFCVNETELRGDKNDKGLKLCSNKQQWEEVVSKFWQGKKKKLMKEIGDYQFIEGPQASWQDRRPHKPIQLNGTYQLCVRQNICARLFDRSLHFALFFESASS